MNEKELKSIQYYQGKLDNDPASFNEYEANDYMKLLKNNDQNDEAIEVGKTFLSMVPQLKGYINQYGYALYNKFVNISDEQIKEKESLFFSIVEEILDLCKQEKYSPVESTVNRVVKYALNQNPVNYELVLKMYDQLNPTLLSDKPYINDEGREFESRKERYYRLCTRAAFELKEYHRCVELANQALALQIKWHYNALQWIKYYRGCSQLELKNYEEANRELISLHNRIRGVNFYEVLYRIHASLNEIKKANTYLLYEFFENGYDIKYLDLYKRLKEATDQTNNELLIQIVDSFIKKLSDENNLSCDLTIASKYQNHSASDLYDEMYNLIMSHLDQYVERYKGRVIHYNDQNQYGSLSSKDEPIFFRQADYIYDEDVQRHDEVKYTIIPTYDSKKQRLTYKAILIQLDESDYDFINH